MIRAEAALREEKELGQQEGESGIVVAGSIIRNERGTFDSSVIGAVNPKAHLRVQVGRAGSRNRKGSPCKN